MGKIETVIHPQSIMHSAIEYEDNCVVAQMSEPDMKLPIQYALTYPKRTKSPVKPLNLTKLKQLQFYKPDFKKFPCLELAFDCAKKGGGYPAVLNAADEVCVGAFVCGKIKFTDISKITEKVVELYKGGSKIPNISKIIETDDWAKSKTRELIENKIY